MQQSVTLRICTGRAAIFWHACGLNETKPERIEHFGMTTVESMQNYCVPIVIDGGGQREIVEQGKSGYRFSTLSQLQEHSLTVITDPQLCQTLAENAYGRSQLFDQNSIQSQTREFAGGSRGQSDWN